MKFKCKKKCYFRKRLWEVGDVIIKREGEVMPKHFKPYTPPAAAVVEPAADEPGEGDNVNPPEFNDEGKQTLAEGQTATQGETSDVSDNMLD